MIGSLWHCAHAASLLLKRNISPEQMPHLTYDAESGVPQGAVLVQDRFHTFSLYAAYISLILTCMYCTYSIFIEIRQKNKQKIFQTSPQENLLNVFMAIKCGTHCL